MNRFLTVRTPLIRVAAMVLLGGMCCAPARARAADEFQWEPVIGIDRQFFPALIIAAPSFRIGPAAKTPERLGDPQEMFGVSLSVPQANAKVRVTVVAEGICDASTLETTLAKADTEYQLFPPLKYQLSNLLYRRHTDTLPLTFRVQVNDDNVSQRVEVIDCHSLADCLLSIDRARPGGKSIDLSFMAAAFIDENHPRVARLLKFALERGAVTSFAGTKSGKAVDVYRQVFALWDALTHQANGHQESPENDLPPANMQIRDLPLLDDLADGVAMSSSETTMLLASAMRKIGIEPTLVLTPNHCVVAFAVDGAGKQMAAIDAVKMLAVVDSDEAEVEGLLAALGNPEWKNDVSWRTFHEGLALGRAMYDHCLKNVARGEPDFLLASIAAGRQKGIRPIRIKKPNGKPPQSTDGEAK